MKDYRSLEQKIIQVVRESIRNTEIRKKQAIVGRPEHDNKDETSKLARHAQIKVKVIDEENIDEKARKIHVHHTGDIAHVKDLNGNIIASYNRREHGENYLRKAHSHIGKVYEDAVSGASTKDSPKEQPESGKKKKDLNKDLMEPGTIKGGKTEVDLDPTTDDRSDDGKKDTDKAKVATRKANREGGIKEEQMNTSKNFGLPADLIATVAEALKGKQEKLDKNHNGKLDKQDFKILRGEKKVTREEAEQVDEGNPVNKTKKNAAVSAVGAKNRDDHYLDRMNPTVADKIRGREKMSGKDRQWHEEVEELDEVNHRDYAAKGMMHPDMAKNMHVGTEGDFYAHGTGDKKYGKVVKNSGGHVHIKQTHDSYSDKKVNKLHKFKISSSMHEETDPGFSAEELARIEEITKGFE
jgi:hypothetical protein